MTHRNHPLEAEHKLAVAATGCYFGASAASRVVR
jgi:hypothetical protein